MRYLLYFHLCNPQKQIYKIYTSNFRIAVASSLWILILVTQWNLENYSGNVWIQVSPHNHYNGYIDAVARGCGALSGLAPAFFVKWVGGGNGGKSTAFWAWTALLLLIIGFGTLGQVLLVECGLVAVLSSYIISVAFTLMGISVLAAEIALMESSESRHKYYTLVIFSCNTFVAAVLQTLDQILTTDTFLNLSLKDRFIVFAVKRNLISLIHQFNNLFCMYVFLDASISWICNCCSLFHLLLLFLSFIFRRDGAINWIYFYNTK